MADLRTRVLRALDQVQFRPSTLGSIIRAARVRCTQVYGNAEAMFFENELIYPPIDCANIAAMASGFPLSAQNALPDEPQSLLQ